jgi:hypothetical protein
MQPTLKTGQPGILPGVLTHGRGVHLKNGFSVGNYQLMDEESTGRKAIQAGIISLGTNNPPAHRIHPMKGIPPRITSSWMLVQIGKVKMREKSSER